MANKFGIREIPAHRRALERLRSPSDARIPQSAPPPPVLSYTPSLPVEPLVHNAISRQHAALTRTELSERVASIRREIFDRRRYIGRMEYLVNQIMISPINEMGEDVLGQLHQELLDDYGLHSLLLYLDSLFHPDLPRLLQRILNEVNNLATLVDGLINQNGQPIAFEELRVLLEDIRGQVMDDLDEFNVRHLTMLRDFNEQFRLLQLNRMSQVRGMERYLKELLDLSN